MKPDNITITNNRNGESITVRSVVYTKGILLQDFDPGAVPATFTSVKGVGQDGETLQNVNINPRFPSISAAIIAESDQDLIIQNKKQIDKIMNPKDELTITVYENSEAREITGHPDGTVQYSTDYKTSNECILSFKIDFECFDPYFRDQETQNIKIETWIANFEFLEFTEDGIELGIKGPKQIEINNTGDVDAPIEVFFHGPGLNPKITLNNDKFIKIDRQIVEGDVLYIYSDYEDIKVQIQNGGVVVEDGYNYINIDSDFFILNQGINILTYETDGDYLPQTVFVKYKSRYFSI